MKYTHKATYIIEEHPQKELGALESFVDWLDALCAWLLGEEEQEG